MDEDSGDDGESTASTAGSLVPPDPGDLVDLTNENVCRVKYRRRVDGKDVEVACGPPIEECVRKNHNLWRLNPATRCGPGYYYPVIKNNGEVLPDGKLSEAKKAANETRPEPTGPHRPVYPLFNRFTSWRNGFSGALILRRTDDS